MLAESVWFAEEIGTPPREQEMPMQAIPALSARAKKIAHRRILVPPALRAERLAAETPSVPAAPKA
jgi:hypothetical protein